MSFLTSRIECNIGLQHGDKRDLPVQFIQHAANNVTDHFILQVDILILIIFRINTLAIKK